MTPAPVLLLTLCLLTQPAPVSERPRSIIAPSLPQLSREEERALDALIDRFMRADVGTLTGPEANQAIRDFNALGMEAVPALIRGLNRAAEINHSCPALQLSRKLQGLLSRSTDPELLEFARDNIGAGVGERSRHRGVFQTMRTQLMLRQNALARLNPPPERRLITPTPPVPPTLGGRDPERLSTTELVRLARTEEGEPLVRVLREVASRRGPDVLPTLAARAGSSTSDIRELSRELMAKHLGGLDAGSLRSLLEHTDSQIRQAAVGVILEKHPSGLGWLLDRLADSEDDIRQQVRQALARNARTVDFGPEPGADDAEARKARDRWRTWWTLNR